MARRRISEVWKDDMRKALDKYHSPEKILPKPMLSSFNLATQWYIIRLREDGIPFRITNLGAGVKEVTVETIKCSHCNGKGYL